MADTLIKFKTGAIENIVKDTTTGKSPVDIAKGTVYFAVDANKQNGKILYDVDDTHRVVMGDQAEYADKAGTADRATYANNAGTAELLATPRAIDGVLFGSNADIAHYGVCSTASNVAAKTVTCANFKLVNGARISVRFASTNIADAPTLNVNNTGAKAIWYNNQAINKSYLVGDRIQDFIYDDNLKVWILAGEKDIDTNTTYTNATSTTSGLMSASDKVKLDTLLTGDKYLKLTGGTLTGQLNGTTAKFTTVTADLTGTADNAKALINTGGRIASANISHGDGKLYYYLATNSMTEGKPPWDSHIIHMAWDNSGGWDTQLAQRHEDGQLAVRGQNSGTWSAWKKIPFDDVATSSVNGLMSSADKAKLDTLQTNATYVSLTGAAPISVSSKTGDITISHNNSGATAGTYGITANQKPGFGGTVNLVGYTVDAKGHITKAEAHTLTIPSTLASSTTNGLMSASDKANFDNGITIAGNVLRMGSSLTKSTLLDSLGLSTAMHYIGIATVAIKDGDTTDPKIAGYDVTKDRLAGDVIQDKDSFREYVWTKAGTWENFGPDGDFALAGHRHNNATSSADGFMSASDKANFDVIKGNYLNNLTTDTANHKLTYTYGMSNTAVDRALNFVRLSGDTMTGDLNFSNSGTGIRQVHFQMGGSDYGRLAVGATADNSGFLEIASAEDGNEPIYARQYTGNFATIKKTLTLLDVNGNTSIPGILSITDTTDSTARTNGSIHTLGGLGVAKQLRVGGATFIDNTLTTTSTTTLNNMSSFTRGSVTPRTTAGTRTSLLIYGDTYGNNAANLANAGRLSYGDPGPQIVFNTVNSLTSGQTLALIYTDHETIGTGVSLSLVSNQTDAWFIAPHIRALTGFTGNLTGNATTATALATARAFQTNLTSDAAVNFNGNANCTMGVTGTLPVKHGGTGTTTFAAGQALIGNGTGAVQTRAIKNITSPNSLDWSTGDTSLINSNTLANWNGAYSGASSNISYTSVGKLGNVATLNKNGSTTEFLRGDGSWVETAQLAHQEKVIAVADWTDSNFSANGVTYPYCYSFDATGVTTDGTIAWLEIISGTQPSDMIINTGPAKINIYTKIKPSSVLDIRAWYIGGGVRGDGTLSDYEKLKNRLDTMIANSTLAHQEKTISTTAWRETSMTTNGITYSYCYSFNATGVTADNTIAWLEIIGGEQAGDMAIGTGTAKINIYTTVKPTATLGVRVWYIGGAVRGNETITQYEQLAQEVDDTAKRAMLFSAGNTAPSDTSGRTAWLDTVNKRLKFYWDGAWRSDSGTQSSTTDISAIVDKIYPVGSIYTSTNSTSPASLFGGTWEQLKDRFLLAAGDTYAAGSTGGEASHTLTVNEMPSHNHVTPIQVFSANVSAGGISLYAFSPNGNYDFVKPNGGKLAHNNMPPYLAVYVWKRIA